jgi:hypothetical protein
MNPALSIWGWAHAVCFLVCITFSICAPEASGFVFVIYMMVAVASLVSLLCFYLLFEVLHALDPAPLISWTITLLAVPLAVCFNSLCFIGVLEGNSGGSHVWREFSDLMGITAIPLVGTLLGVVMNLRQINNYNHATYSSESDINNQ